MMFRVTIPMRTIPVLGEAIFQCAAILLPLAAALGEERSYRLPPTDLKERVIWGAVCEAPDGSAIAFGGQDQEADDGCAHTRIRSGGVWRDIQDELRAANPLEPCRARCASLARAYGAAGARARRIFFSGLPRTEEARRSRAELGPLLDECRRELRAILAELRGLEARLPEYPAGQASRACSLLAPLDAAATADAGGEASRAPDVVTAALVRRLASARVTAEQAADRLGAEPPPRALSPIAYDSRSGLHVLFGGDHLDFLDNSTWVFDPAKRQWRERHPATAPPPRANHELRASGDGRIVLAGGYAYASSTDYCGGQYRDVGDGEWTYDVIADVWTGKSKGVSPLARAYRTGPFDPDFFLRDPEPEAAPFAAWLAAVPANTWVMTRPPHLPEMNRDWGTAVLDPDRGLILRWSGGHSAHGGTDVLHYHMATNRWELPFPVEFPLGQLYANTDYPDGVNLNGRPWITGHTYQSYGYEPRMGKMLFTGRREPCHVYDPDLGDWTGRFPKPPGMTYGDCFYTLTICPTTHGLVTWTEEGRLFLLHPAPPRWEEIETRGLELPGSVVDNSTVVHDERRDRLIFARKEYGDEHRYDGQLHAYDWKTREVTILSPEGMAAAAAIPYLCQIRRDPANDLLLVGGTLPPGADGARRTPAYDCAANEWISLRIGGEDPSGEEGRNVSLGLVYDGSRGLFWAVDTHSQVFVLRLLPQAADRRPLGGITTR